MRFIHNYTLLSFREVMFFKTMNSQCIILLVNYLNCIMILQIADNIGNFNQMSTDYGNFVTLATNRDNESTELTFGNKHHYNRDQLYELMLRLGMITDINFWNQRHVLL